MYAAPASKLPGIPTAAACTYIRIAVCCGCPNMHRSFKVTTYSSGCPDRYASSVSKLLSFLQMPLYSYGPKYACILITADKAPLWLPRYASPASKSPGIPLTHSYGCSGMHPQPSAYQVLRTWLPGNVFMWLPGNVCIPSLHQVQVSLQLPKCSYVCPGVHPQPLGYHVSL